MFADEGSVPVLSERQNLGNLSPDPKQGAGDHSFSETTLEPQYFGILNIHWVFISITTSCEMNHTKELEFFCICLTRTMDAEMKVSAVRTLCVRQ